MVYRENDRPRWRSAAIDHRAAGFILEAAGREVGWKDIDGILMLSMTDLREAVALFLDRLADAGVPADCVKVTFQPATKRAGSRDSREEFIVFYRSHLEVAPHG